MRFLFTALSLAILFSLSSAHAGNVERGQQKSVACQACHGADGNGMGDPQYPKLGGQYADYLEVTLRRYRSGERENAIMYGFASTLSDQDIRDLAAFYASQPRELKILGR